MRQRAVWLWGLIAAGVVVTAAGVGLWMTRSGKTGPASGGSNIAQSSGAGASTTGPSETPRNGSATPIERYDEALRARLARTQDERHASSVAVEASVGRLGRLKPGAETDEGVAAVARQGDVAVAEIRRQLVERDADSGWWRCAVRVLEAVNSEQSRELLRRVALGEMSGADRLVQGRAARALIACDPRQAWPLLASTNGQVLASALNAVHGQPVDEKHMSLLGECLGHTNALVRWRAAEVMADDPTGKRGNEAVEAVGQALEAVAGLPDVNQPYRGMLASGSTVGDACYQRHMNILVRVKVDNEALRALAERMHGRARDAVLLALARRDDESVHDELVRLAQDPEADLFRVWAADALGGIGTPEDLPLLRTLAETDPLVIGEPFGPDEGPPRVLPPGVTGRSYPVRNAAERAIREIEKRERAGRAE